MDIGFRKRRVEMNICFLCRNIIQPGQKQDTVPNFPRKAPQRHLACALEGCETVELTKDLYDYIKEFWGK